MTVILTKKRIALLLAALAGVAFAVSWSGLIPIAASSGHLPPVAWFLHWTMGNAVRTQSLMVEMPADTDLRDPDLVRRGASHFASSCAPCHGAPDAPADPVFQQMTPAAPALTRTLSEWDDEELFWIVKHGVKFTGMPAWPTQQRNDEVWAMVALLRALPRLDGGEFRRLALGTHEHAAEQSGHDHGSAHGRERQHAPDDAQATGARPLDDCARCHGHDGTGQGRAAFPVIAGQSEDYLYATLKAFADGRRNSGIMRAATAQLSDAQLRELARHYAGEAGNTNEDGANDAALARAGEQIVNEGVVRLGIPACSSCHGEEATRRNANFPRLHGQHAGYLKTHLMLFKEDRRGGTPYAQIMTMIAERLPRSVIEAVAAYYASVPSDADNRR